MTTIAIEETIVTVSKSGENVVVTATPTTVNVRVQDGSSSFVALNDTPSAYTGHSGETVVVKNDESGLEFALPNFGGSVDSVNGQTGVVVLDASDVGADPSGTAASLVAAESSARATADANRYTKAETDALLASVTGSVDSVNGQTGIVILDASDVGAEAAGAVAAHIATPDPHPQYQTQAEGDLRYATPADVSAEASARATADANRYTKAETDALLASLLNIPGADARYAQLTAANTFTHGPQVFRPNDANALEVQADDGTRLLDIDENAHVHGVRIGLGSAANTYYSEGDPQNEEYRHAVYLNVRDDNVIGPQRRTVGVRSVIGHTSADTGYPHHNGLFAFDGYVYTKAGSLAPPTIVAAQQMEADHNSDAHLDRLLGTTCYVYNNASGTIEKLYGHYIDAAQYGTGRINSLIAFEIEADYGSGPVTERVGLHIGDQTSGGADTAYAIKTDGGDVVIVGGTLTVDGVAFSEKASTADLNVHTANTSNPHGVTAVQVGAYTVSATDALLAAKAAIASPALTGIPTAPTAASGTSTNQIATTAFVKAALDLLINSAPGTLDTLGEIAAQLATDESAVSALTTLVSDKLAKSANLSDLTDASAARSNLSLGALATLSSITASLISDASANGRSLITAADYAAMRTLLSLVVGANVQAFDADLSALAALSSTGIAKRTGADTWTLQTKITEADGGTNQSTYTTGDLLYASAANTLSKLAGNTATTRKFLRQTGSGSASAAPVWDVLTPDDGAVVPAGRFGTTFFNLPGVFAAGGATSPLVANQVRYFPIMVTTPITLDQLVLEVTTAGAAATTIRMGLFTADLDWQPSARVLDAGTVAADSTGIKTLSINQTLTPGRYLLACNSDGAPTLRSVRGGIMAMSGIVAAIGATPSLVNLRASQTYGAFSSTPTAWTAAQNGNQSFDYVIFTRVSAP